MLWPSIPQLYKVLGDSCSFHHRQVSKHLGEVGEAVEVDEARPFSAQQPLAEAEAIEVEVTVAMAEAEEAEVAVAVEVAEVAGAVAEVEEGAEEAVTA